MRRLLKIKLGVILVVAAIFCIVGAKLFLNAVYVPVIMMYHSVGNIGQTLDSYSERLNVTPQAFEKQMKFLHDHHYNVIDLAELIKKIKNGEKVSYKTVAITFDDGLKNNFLYAYPALKRYNFPATIFVIADFIGKKNFVSEKDILTMQDNNISVGSHTLSHKWLAALDEEELKKELIEAKSILEKMTGRKVETLAYPMGAFNDGVIKAAEEAGYIGAVTTNPGKKYPSNNPYALKRIRISMSSNNLIAFWVETSGYYTFIKEWRDKD